MLKELIPSFKKSIDDRLSNPILGTFGVAWIFINWRILYLLLFSDKITEDKITFIETNYSDWKLLVLFPLLFTTVYLVVFPWILLGIQILQEKANGQRKNHKLEADTNYAKLRVSLVEAESKIESIKLRYTLEDEMLKKRNEMELERDKARHDFDIERERRRLEYEFEERKAEYEENRKRRENEMRFDSKMRELDFEERKRRDQLELERMKIENERMKQ